MSVLANFPLISQTTKISTDGSSPNAEFDCVPTSILAGLMYLNGITSLSTEWNPDKLLDMAYAEGYTGGTSASAFVSACAKLGCKLSAIQGIPGKLVGDIHAHIQQDHPVIVTVPDIYVPASYGWTHVLCAYSETSGYITMLDPWPGKPTTKSDGEWANLLQFQQIWILERSEAMPKIIEITEPEIAKYFELASPDGRQWRCRVAVNGKQSSIKDGMLDFYRAYGNSALCGLTYLGLPVSGEIPLDASGNTRQHFERGVLFYDPQHQYDNAPGAGTVYLAHLYTGQGQDPRLAQLQTQLTQAQSSGNLALQAKIAKAIADLS